MKLYKIYVNTWTFFLYVIISGNLEGNQAIIISPSLYHCWEYIFLLSPLESQVKLTDSPTKLDFGTLKFVIFAPGAAENY